MPDKGEERNKAQIKILNRTRMNTEKYKTKQRDAKTSCIKKKKAHDFKVLEGMEEAI